MRKVWITRTQPAADESAEIWRAAGFDPLVEPLLAIESAAHEEIPKTTVLIFTSRNAIDHIACRGQRAICVGDATAAKARAAGFTDVISVDGTAADVTQWVKANLPTTHSICHVSGWHVRGSITEDLHEAGYAAQRVKVYYSAPQSIWPECAFSSIAFYSPLAAKTFADLAIDLCEDMTGLTAICISQAVADELSSLSLKSVCVAARPREDELIMAVKSV